MQLELDLSNTVIAQRVAAIQAQRDLTLWRITAANKKLKEVEAKLITLNQKLEQQEQMLKHYNRNNT